MTAIELAKSANLNILNIGDGNSINISGIYCCDLLSFSLANINRDAVWITVISNINTIAVAALTNVSCVIISNSVPINDDVLKKAQENNICLLSSELPTFETSVIINNLINQAP